MFNLVKILHVSQRAVADILNNLATGSATVVSIFGAVDANMVQAWGGALVAIGTGVWGLWRDQRRRDRENARHEKWDAFITAHRMELIAKTGKDPFEHGPPPLDFVERIEATYAEGTVIQTKIAGQEDVTDKSTKTDKPPRPKWAKRLSHLFR